MAIRPLRAFQDSTHLAAQERNFVPRLTGSHRLGHALCKIMQPTWARKLQGWGGVGTCTTAWLCILPEGCVSILIALAAASCTASISLSISGGADEVRWSVNR